MYKIKKKKLLNLTSTSIRKTRVPDQIILACYYSVQNVFIFSPPSRSKEERLEIQADFSTWCFFN